MGGRKQADGVLSAGSNVPLHRWRVRKPFDVYNVGRVRTEMCVRVCDALLGVPATDRFSMRGQDQLE